MNCSRDLISVTAIAFQVAVVWACSLGGGGGRKDDQGRMDATQDLVQISISGHLRARVLFLTVYIRSSARSRSLDLKRLDRSSAAHASPSPGVERIREYKVFHSRCNVIQSQKSERFRLLNKGLTTYGKSDWNMYSSLSRREGKHTWSWGGFAPMNWSKRFPSLKDMNVGI